MSEEIMPVVEEPPKVEEGSEHKEEEETITEPVPTKKCALCNFLGKKQVLWAGAAIGVAAIACVTIAIIKKKK